MSELCRPWMTLDCMGLVHNSHGLLAEAAQLASACGRSYPCKILNNLAGPDKSIPRSSGSRCLQEQAQDACSGDGADFGAVHSQCLPRYFSEIRLPGISWSQLLV